MPLPSDATPDDPLVSPPLRVSAKAGRSGLVAVLLILIVHAGSYSFTSDDAFIVARYARNVVEGHGWVYNVGERVEGYTSFLWVALTALLARLGMDYVTAVRALSLAGALACAALMHWAAPRVGVPRDSLLACLAPALFASTGAVACWALGGLEACGFALAILAAVHLLYGERPRSTRLVLAGLMCGVCTLVRPEGLLVFGGLAVCLLLEEGRKPWRRVGLLALPCAIIAGTHLFWRHHYYGEWLPNTYYAKAGFGYHQCLRGYSYVNAFMADHGGLILWVIPLVWPWLSGRNVFARRCSVVAALLTLGVVLVGGDGLPMYRFMVPIVPLWAMLVQRMAGDLLRLAGGAETRMGATAARLALAGLIVCLIVPLATPPKLAWQYSMYRTQKHTEVPNWRAAGEWLAENASPDASVACVPIGAVGYYSRLHVYDMMGLTDPHIARKEIRLGKGRAGHEKHDGPYILSCRPTYLLLGNVQVLKMELDPSDPMFVKPSNPEIRAREDDIFIPELFEWYAKRVVRLPNGGYFHFLERRPES